VLTPAAGAGINKVNRNAFQDERRLRRCGLKDFVFALYPIARKVAVSSPPTPLAGDSGKPLQKCRGFFFFLLLSREVRLLRALP
jgi:hypothetical protein